MSLLSWFRGITQPKAPRLVLNGHETWWPKESLPINVWLDNDTWSSTALVAARLLRSYGAPLMFPVPLEAETRNRFFASRETFRSAIVIQPYVMTNAPGPFKCTSDIRYDKRTGEMRNALIEWNIYEPSTSENLCFLMHEFGHCLGLGHCDGTVMQERPNPNGWLPPSFNEAQMAYLRGMR